MDYNDIYNFKKFYVGLYGKHESEKDKVYVLQRKPSMNGYIDTKQISFQLQDRQQLIHHIKDNSELDFSITPVIYKSETGKKDIVNIAGIYAFWCEIDAGNIGHQKKELPFQTMQELEKAIYEKYQDINLMPSIILNSGHGYHLYWLFNVNLVNILDAETIKAANDLLYKVVVDYSPKFYNEVSYLTALMRTSIPTVNRKILDCPASTHITFTDIIYELKPVMLKLKELKFNLPSPACGIADMSDEVLQNIDIDLVEADNKFMDWVSSSSDLIQYSSTAKEFPSSSEKEFWIIKYLYKANLTVREILDFIKGNMDYNYHIFRSRQNDNDKLKYIEFCINQALRYQENNGYGFPDSLIEHIKNNSECNWTEIKRYNKRNKRRN